MTVDRKSSSKSIICLLYFRYWICKICDKVYKSTDKLAAHKRASCDISASEKQLWLNVGKSHVASVNVYASQSTTALQTAKSVVDVEELRASSPSTVVSGKFVERYMDQISIADSQRAIDYLVTWIYRTQQPLSIASSDSFKTFIRFLRPTFLKFLPSANTIGGSLLDQAYERLKATLLGKVKDQILFSIVSDGWTDLNRRHLVNIMVVTPLHRRFFLKRFDTSGESMTGEFIFKMISEVAIQLGINKWISFISDSAANMRSAWDLIEKLIH